MSPEDFMVLFYFYKGSKSTSLSRLCCSQVPGFFLASVQSSLCFQHWNMGETVVSYFSL